MEGVLVDFNLLREQYYAGLGWSKDGRPLPARLNELGLTDVVKEDWQNIK